MVIGYWVIGHDDFSSKSFKSLPTGRQTQNPDSEFLWEDNCLHVYQPLFLSCVFKSISVAKQRKYNIAFRIWFLAGEKKFIGKGRVELLERIKRTGSITNAAKGMKMSYRQAWQMVADMNELSGVPLVEKMLGGKGGGGAIVTSAGEKAIDEFHKFEDDVRGYIHEKSKKISL